MARSHTCAYPLDPSSPCYLLQGLARPKVLCRPHVLKQIGIQPSNARGRTSLLLHMGIVWACFPTPEPHLHAPAAALQIGTAFGQAQPPGKRMGRVVPASGRPIDVSQNKRQVSCYPLRAEEYFIIWIAKLYSSRHAMQLACGCHYGRCGLAGSLKPYR